MSTATVSERTDRLIRKPTVVASIPAYNEERSIAKVIVGAKKEVDRVIVCDDGSKDATAEIANALGAEVVAHDRNMGYGAALASLFARAANQGVDVMVTIDGDGQHDPSAIGQLTKPILSGEADIVIGSRFVDGGESDMPAYRRAGAKAITRLSDSISHNRISDAQSGYRAYNRKAIETTAPTELGMGASTEILARAADAGLRVLEVPIAVAYNEESSTHNPVYHAVDVVLSTVKRLSIKHPLIFYGVPGFASLVIAAVFWSWTFDLFATAHRVVTNVALVAVATTIVGLILMAIAVMLWVLVSVVREGR